MLVAFGLSFLVIREPITGPRLVLLYVPCTLNKTFLPPDNQARYTPNLKAFANQSIVFTNHQTEAPFSGAAYASLFTGTRTYRHGIYYHPAPLSDENYLIAEAFRDNGYETFFWNAHDLASEELNFAQGIKHQNVANKQPGDGRVLTENDNKFMTILRRLQWNPGYKAYIQVGFSITHAPYTKNSDMETTALFCKQFPEECPGVTRQDLVEYSELYKSNHIALTYHFDQAAESLGLQPEQVTKLVKVLKITYKSSVHNLDHAFGQTLDAIRRAGLMDQSLLVFTSDHGEVLFRKKTPIKWGHGMLEPEVLNIPLIIHFPGQQRSTFYHELSRSIDIFPTLVSICSLKIPGSTYRDGVDLSKAALGKAVHPNLVAFSCSEMSHPAVGYNDPKMLRVQATTIDTEYKLSSIQEGSRLSVFRSGENPDSRKDLFNPADPTHLEMKKKLTSYRDLLIKSYRTSKDEENWDEVREKLRSLGYIQ